MSFRWTRRQVLAGAALAAAAGGAAGVGQDPSALASVTVGPETNRRDADTLVTLFLRGGADGLNIVAPYGDEHYYRLRPTLALPRPNDRSAPQSARLLDLDGFFGLHPALAPLLPLYHEGRFTAVHAIGSGDQTRSHFEAMATMERGLARDSGSASGWIARHLAATAAEGESPLRAVAIGETLPDSLRGATNATALTSLSEFQIAPILPPTGTGGRMHHAGLTPESRTGAFETTLRALYRVEEPHSPRTDAVHAAGKETLSALAAIRRLDPANYRPAPLAHYPQSELGNGFRQAACLIKGDVGLEAACLEAGGWDTHVAQGRDTGWQPARLSELGAALAAFAADLGPRLDRVTILVMTEFGRRAYENSGLGTDHGRASCLLLLGGALIPGKVYAEWPGLAPDSLDGPGDLRVTTDYRDLLAEIVAFRLKNRDLAAVFPDYTPRFRGIVRHI